MSNPTGPASGGKPQVCPTRWLLSGTTRVGSSGRLWFVTIHPFDDGSGCVARAIADMALARSEGSSQRFYSMSSQIRAERSGYYRVLERTQKGTTEVTDWMGWFLACLGRAIHGAENTLAAVLTKARFWSGVEHMALNGRQRRVLDRLLDGFEGKLTTSRWARLTKCSQDTAPKLSGRRVGHPGGDPGAAQIRYRSPFRALRPRPSGTLVPIPAHTVRLQQTATPQRQAPPTCDRVASQRFGVLVERRLAGRLHPHRVRPQPCTTRH